LDSIKYFGPNDLSCVYYLEQIESVLDNLNTNNIYKDINNIFIIYNSMRYIENDIFLVKWDSDKINSYKDKLKYINVIIGKYFASINNENIVDEYLRCNKIYKDDFWYLFEKYQLRSKISNEIFIELINSDNSSIWQILKYKKIVETYSSIIRDYLLEFHNACDILLQKYEFDMHKKVNIYLPKELNLNDKEVIISNYIDSANAHLNKLEVIRNIRNTSELSISDKIRLNAKKKIDLEYMSFSEKKDKMTFTINVACVKEQKDEKIFKINDCNTLFHYSETWIENNKDYNTLLNNFIYLFKFVDMQMLITLVNKKSEMSILEQHMFIHSKNDYFTGITFQFKNNLAFIQLLNYYEVLSKSNIFLEDVFEWFFNTYLLEEFHAENFSVKMPSTNMSYFEKCRFIFPEMESILKKFKLYVEEKHIDPDLLQISSEPLIIDSIPSFVKIKYVYRKGSKFEKIIYLLFSDQCMLSHVDRIKKSYDNFFELIINEKIVFDDYEAHHLAELTWLRDNNVIKIVDNKYIAFSNFTKIQILKKLFENEVVSYWNTPSKYREAISEMDKEGLTEFSSTLFSKPEQDYISFILNKAKFNNGLDLRNRYLHGTQPNDCNNADIHKENYFKAMKLLVMYIIKINDEFCIKDREL